MKTEQLLYEWLQENWWLTSVVNNDNLRKLLLYGNDLFDDNK